jgi:hypothetical protein
MDQRFLIGLAGLLIFVGGGYAWLSSRILLRKRFTKSLLSLPKERRFFWYLLRKNGFRVVRAQCAGVFRVDADGEILRLGAKADFLAAKGGRKFACVVTEISDGPRELARAFLACRAAFRVDGAVFFEPESRSFHVWSKAESREEP